MSRLTSIPRLATAILLLAQVAAPAQGQIPLAEYAARRDSLAARLDSGIVVAFSGRTPVTDRGPFYQLAAFHYLTAFDEPDATFVMVVRGGKGTGTLFITPKPPRTALYYGVMPDSAATSRATGLPSRPADGLRAALDSLVATGLPFYTISDVESADFAKADSLTRGQQIMRALAEAHPGLVVRDAHPIVAELRARKSPAELALLRRAAAISDSGHRAAMRLIAPGLHEYDLQAVLEAAFLRGGAQRSGYGSIVGAGVNATTLHYMKNRAPLKAGDVVVIDAAAELDGYSADVTRTLPVSGTFTPEQRGIYALVLAAQKAAERNSRSGMSALSASDSAFDIRAAGLARLGLIESPDSILDLPWKTDCTTSSRSCSQAVIWTIHGISHGLGLEVHDPAQFYAGDHKFKIGDVFTIEPGIYVRSSVLGILPDTPRNRRFIAKVRPVAARYENIGVRIEDDYVITERGLERISHAPREIGEVEALTSKARSKRPTASAKGGCPCPTVPTRRI
jgi:Xaa-Pro aminopeptidase